ncbi:MAG: Na(+)-translocating NADH-quinone reductase subunit A [Bacteroidales bacterium]|nr:Na(+)-translocating NADH-quinone reductase subunit A [Bacteroidales bacterium]
MSEHIRLKKGLDIPLAGAAPAKIAETVADDLVALKPTDFKALVPKLAVKEGDSVQAGDVLFTDKMHPAVRFCSPCSGVVQQIVRGDKRKLLAVVVKADGEHKSVKFDAVDCSKLDKQAMTEALLERGLWPMIKQRPYGIIANAEDTPKSIFVSAMNTAPLAPDPDFIMDGRLDDLQEGVNALCRLTKGGVHFSMAAAAEAGSAMHNLKGVIFHTFDGPHPAGNVGIQINHISPINKGEIVWTVDLVSLAAMGRCLRTGEFDMTRPVAVTGPAAKEPCYVMGVQGMSLKAIAKYAEEGNVRYVSGDVLTGTNVGAEGFLGFFDSQVTLLEEGDYYELLGWIKPFRLKKFSFSHLYWSWLAGKKKTYKLDTNTNGGPRAFVVSDVYGKVLPMDILPVYLLKACMAKDIEKMENLGIYEVIPEDFALCEFVCPSKIEIQQILSDGIDLMLKEMA